MTVVDLAAFLGEHPPFDSLAPDALAKVADRARIGRYADGELVLDAFADPAADVYVVVEGRVRLWNDVAVTADEPDELLGPGGVFGFSAMLTERSIGPRAVAAGPAAVARVPAAVATPAFTSRRGARFLAERVGSVHRRTPGAPRYSAVEELVPRPPLVVEPHTPVGDVARRMTEEGVSCAVVACGADGYGLVTDALLRAEVLVAGRPSATPAREVMDAGAPTVVEGESAAEALMLLLDRDAEFLVVTDRGGDLRGVVAPRDFAISPTTAGVSLLERLRRAGTVDELTTTARGVPGMLGELLAQGLASGRVLAVYSTLLDAIVRRAITFIFRDAAGDPLRDGLSVDAFTWLSLGSNGRREAVLSSDVDSAAAFVDAVTPHEVGGYREVFGEVYHVLAAAGLSRDTHGVTAQHALFARTNAQWRAAGREWLAAPEKHNGAMMTSLLVDGRPIHGDPGLPAVTRVFGDLRAHPGTMRLLLQESLAKRAKSRSVRGLLSRRADTFDIKAHALLPVVNMARWAALSVGSPVLPTTERLRAAAGSAMLPDDQAHTLTEVFEVLQRVRLRYQLMQAHEGSAPSDVMVMRHLSPIDRSVISQAVREIAAVQRRMDNVAQFVPVEEWTAPDPGP